MKEEYLAGKGTLRELAAAWNVNQAAVLARGNREKWDDLRKQAANSIQIQARGIIQRKAGEHASQVLRFVTRSLTEGAQFQDRIMSALSAAGNPDDDTAYQVRALASAWKDVVQLQRLTYRLDEAEPGSSGGLGAVRRAGTERGTVIDAEVVDVQTGEVVDHQRPKE